MHFYKITKNPSFIGRYSELRRLETIYKQPSSKAKLIIVHGRRRIGKTELIEHFCHDKKVWRFEGIQLPEDAKKSGTQRRSYQLQLCMRQLAKYLEQPGLANLRPELWTDFFELIHPVAMAERVVLYFEEIQWLASYRGEFFAELKPYWDTQWSRNPELTIIICGSSSSFITSQFLRSQAMYARGQEELKLSDMNLLETQQLLGNKGRQEALMAHLLVGGVPGYLERLVGRGTVYSRMCESSFTKDAPFLLEYERIFVSRMSRFRHYREIINHLAQRRFGTAKEIAKAVTGSPKTGGKLEEILADLDESELIESYVPVDKADNSRLVRYRIRDEYLHFFFRFIRPIRKRIQQGVYSADPTRALNRQMFHQALGYAFERWCIRNAAAIAKLLQIDRLSYSSGSYFSRAVDRESPGFQIDLMFLVEQVKVILCEIKYRSKIEGRAVAEEMDQKAERFRARHPRYKNATVERVLITAQASEDVDGLKASFDEVLGIDDLFEMFS